MAESKEYKPLRMDQNMPFGKHKGEPISDLVENETDYIKYLIDKTDIKFESDVLQAVGR